MSVWGGQGRWFLPSAQHLGDAFGECPVLGKKTQIKPTPSYNNTLTSQRESRGGPQDPHAPTIKEILIKYRTKVSRIVKQQHKDLPGSGQGLGLKSSKGCTRKPPDIPTPYFSLLNYNWQHRSAHWEPKLRHRDPKGFPPGPAETRITFRLIPTSRRLWPMLSFPSVFFHLKELLCWHKDLFYRWKTAFSSPLLQDEFVQRDSTESKQSLTFNVFLSD